MGDSKESVDMTGENTLRTDGGSTKAGEPERQRSGAKIDLGILTEAENVMQDEGYSMRGGKGKMHDEALRLWITAHKLGIDPEEAVRRLKISAENEILGTAAERLEVMHNDIKDMRSLMISVNRQIVEQSESSSSSTGRSGSQSGQDSRLS